MQKLSLPLPLLSRPTLAPSGGLALAAALVGIVLAVPVLVVAGHLAVPGTAGTWSHLLQTVLPEYVATTLKLCLGVGVGVAVVGVATAWLTAAHDFPGKKVFEWALILPLAVPTYVLAYAYTDFLQPAGTVQGWLRATFGLRYGDYWFPDVRSLKGASALFTLAFYPYVYLLARTAFLERAASLQEAGRSLGLGSWATFLRIALPLARPALAAGVALALMETLADFGAVSYFAVQTFTVGIYRTWYFLGDRAAAAQLAAALLGFVVLVLFLERLSRGRARYAAAGGGGRPHPSHRLEGVKAAAAFLVCSLPVLLGFLLPAAVLLGLLLKEPEFPLPPERFWLLAKHSFSVSGIAAVLAVLLALVLSYGVRLTKGRLSLAMCRLVGLGYAVPGVVIAVGILIPVARLDNWLADRILATFTFDPGLLFTGGIAALVYAYLVRYSALALQTVEAGLTRITPSMDDAARGLGAGQAETLWRVHLPLLRGSLLSAGLLVFVDVMKELPATLVMRPFNFDTLATQAFIFAKDERLAELAAPSLAIVAVGVLPVVLLAHAIARGRG
jgi:iron(III) transport system permease protein